MDLSSSILIMNYFSMFKNQTGLTSHLKSKVLKIRSQSDNCSLSAGLTLVEALVTLVVLSFGLIPTLAVLSSSIRLASLIENNLIAANLAQEGVEVVRSLRDANWFANRPFNNGLVGSWRVEWNTNWTTNLPQPIGLNQSLKFNSSTGIYNYSTGVDTNFKRWITVAMSPDPCNCDLVVVSNVQWIQQGKTRTKNVEAHLFDWK